MLDWCIYGAFVIDYVVFLLRSANKGEYVREHICEVIALIPFDSLFRAARLLRLLKLARLFTCGSKVPLFPMVPGGQQSRCTL